LTKVSHLRTFLLNYLTIPDLSLNSVSRPGTKIFIPKGDSVLIVKTATGGIYLRTDNGQIADAGQTKYAQTPPAPHPDEIIELD
jgi:hypothetical protein